MTIKQTLNSKAATYGQKEKSIPSNTEFIRTLVILAHNIKTQKRFIFFTFFSLRCTLCHTLFSCATHILYLFCPYNIHFLRSCILYFRVKHLRVQRCGKYMSNVRLCYLRFSNENQMVRFISLNIKLKPKRAKKSV